MRIKFDYPVLTVEMTKPTEHYANKGRAHSDTREAFQTLAERFPMQPQTPHQHPDMTATPEKRQYKFAAEHSSIEQEFHDRQRRLSENSPARWLRRLEQERLARLDHHGEEIAAEQLRAYEFFVERYRADFFEEWLRRRAWFTQEDERRHWFDQTIHIVTRKDENTISKADDRARNEAESSVHEAVERVAVDLQEIPALIAGQALAAFVQIGSNVQTRQNGADMNRLDGAGASKVKVNAASRVWKSGG